jgi:hypothetical protein
VTIGWYNEVKLDEGADTMPVAVTEQQTINALHAVPAERWAEVLRFLEALQARTSPSPEPRIQTADDLLHSGLVGIWADRFDLDNSRAFARRLREQAERREGGPNAAGQ